MNGAVMPDLWPTLLRSFAMLCVVLGLLLLFLYLVKRLSGYRRGEGGEGLIRLLAAYPVAPRERILLLEVMGERILVGVTPQHINCLAVLDGDKFVMPEEGEPAPGGKKFLDLLKGALGEGKGNEKSES